MTTQATGALGAVENPLSGAVIQREGKTATIDVRVKASEAGTLYARLREGRSVVDGFKWKKIGSSDGTIAAGALAKVPIGGEYTLELQLRRGETVIGRVSVGRLLVGDIWITGGQSNMDGWGKLVNTEPPSKQVHAFYFDDTWDTAADPLCWYNESIDPIHWGETDETKRRRAIVHDRKLRQNGAGPAVAFGKAVNQATGIPIGLIVCSHGGTSMDQWSPEKLDRGGHSLYGSMVRRVKAVGGKVTGLIWYQGESDANAESQALYKERMRKFIAAVRRDLDAPKLPFLYVQIGPFYTDPEVAIHWDAIKNDQLEVEKDLAPAGMVASIDAGLADQIHLDTASGRRIGRRLANLAKAIVYKPESLELGPRPLSARFIDRDRTTLHVTFSGVNESLSPKRDIRGFGARKDNEDLLIESQEVHPDKPNVVVIKFCDPVPHLSAVWYGLGVNPVVNLTDKEDMPVPAFGPITI